MTDLPLIGLVARSDEADKKNENPSKQLRVQQQAANSRTFQTCERLHKLLKCKGLTNYRTPEKTKW